MLVLPVEIAGYAARIQRGFRGLGWEADVLDLSGDPYGYGATPPGDPVLRMLAVAHRIVASRPVPLRGAVRVLTMPLRLIAAVRSSGRYDAILYLYGRSLLAGLDVNWARRRGARTIVVYLGSDSRPPYLSGFHVNAEGQVRWDQVRRATLRTARKVRRMERAADVVICHHPSAQLLSRPFVSWLAIGMPVDPPTVPPRRTESSAAEPLRVLHAPSRRRQKGSDNIEAAVHALAADGWPLELVSLTGVPNPVVREELIRSDIVVDELYSDTVLGGLGVEAAAAGVAPLVFGNATAALVPVAERLGIPHAQYADPADLAAVLKHAVSDSAWRSALAASVRAYVEERCTPVAVAERLVALIAGTAPSDWWTDPAEVSYVHGFGMSRQVAEAVLREYVDRFGFRALCLPANSGARGAVHALLAGGRVSRRRSGAG